MNFVPFEITSKNFFSKISMKCSKNGQKIAMSKNTSNMLFETCWTSCKKPHFSMWSRSRNTFFWMTRYFVCNFCNWTIPILGSLNNAEYVKRQFFSHQISNKKRATPHVYKATQCFHKKGKWNLVNLLTYYFIKILVNLCREPFLKIFLSHHETKHCKKIAPYLGTPISVDHVLAVMVYCADDVKCTWYQTTLCHNDTIIIHRIYKDI